MSYIGKDVIHYGCGIELNPDEAIKKISSSARKNIKKAEQFNISVLKSTDAANDLEAIRKIWYYPSDPNFPQTLDKNDIAYLAYLDNELIGGMVLVQVGSHYFLNNLTANDRGKECQVQGYLLWNAVNDLCDSPYKYIDIGVSYRPNLYRFFKKWATFFYPVIFNPPKITPEISFYPFKLQKPFVNEAVTEQSVSKFCLDRPYTVVPNLELAEEILQDKKMLFKCLEFPNKSSENIQVVDLTQLLPIQYGAIIIGLEISTPELWEKYGAYDFVKTEYIKRVISHPGNSLDNIISKRKEVFSCFKKYFEIEDITMFDPQHGFPSFTFKTQQASKLNEVYKRFNVQTKIQDETLSLPCHQALTSNDIEYIYAIYRGVLNLCSEWAPTDHRGTLKV